MRASVAIAVGAALGLLAPAARAQSDDGAEAHIRAGLAAREHDDDARALEEFQRAYALSHGARALAQVGLAEQALGRWIDADTHLRAALADATEPWIARNRAALERALGTIDRHVGWLDVLSDTPGATVVVDGRDVGPAPARATLSEGSHAIEVRAEGFATASRTVAVTAGARARETVDLVARPPEPTPPAARRATTRVSPAPPPVAVDTRAPRRAAGGAALGAAVLAAAGSAVALVAREDRVEHYNAPACADPFAPRQAVCGYLLDQAGTYEALAIAGFAVSAALAATGVVLIATAPPPSRAPTRARAACGPWANGAGIHCAVAF